MSDNRREQLKKTLVELDREEQAWVINFLVQQLSGYSDPTRRKAKKLHDEGFSDDQWDTYFENMPAKELPSHTEPLNDIYKATAGKSNQTYGEMAVNQVRYGEIVEVTFKFLGEGYKVHPALVLSGSNLREDADEFDLSDITATPQELQREDIIAAAEAAAFAEEA